MYMHEKHVNTTKQHITDVSKITRCHSDICFYSCEEFYSGGGGRKLRYVSEYASNKYKEER
jgi:hypothetical protein